MRARLVPGRGTPHHPLAHSRTPSPGSRRTPAWRRRHRARPRCRESPGRPQTAPRPARAAPASKGRAVTVLHVRRVGGQQIERAVDTVQIGCRDELDSVADAMTCRIPLRHDECLRRDIGCDDAAIGQLESQERRPRIRSRCRCRPRDASRSSRGCRASTTQERQRLFDDELGFRAGNQHGRRRPRSRGPRTLGHRRCRPSARDARDGRSTPRAAAPAPRAEGPADPRAASRDPSSGWCSA